MATAIRICYLCKYKIPLLSGCHASRGIADFPVILQVGYNPLSGFNSKFWPGFSSLHSLIRHLFFDHDISLSHKFSYVSSELLYIKLMVRFLGTEWHGYDEYSPPQHVNQSQEIDMSSVSNHRSSPWFPFFHLTLCILYLNKSALPHIMVNPVSLLL